MSPRIRKYLFVLYVSLQLADGILTYIGISKFGPQMEGNPVMRQLFELCGVVDGLLVMKAAATLSGYCAYKWRMDYVMYWIVFIYTFIAVVPWCLFLFWGITWSLF